MQPHFRAVSLSYKSAPISFREQISLSEAEYGPFLHHLRDTLDLSELLVLSTCNRTEVYYVAERDLSSDIIRLIGWQRQVADREAFEGYFEIFNNAQAATRHLFRVALGLESKVVGDMQIINQVKRAYQTSADCNLAGPFLHRLLHTIFFTNKRVVQETCFRDGAASVSYAAVELVEELTADLTSPKVLILGVGEIGTDVAKNLENTDITDVTICNRTLVKAERLAERVGARVVPFENVWQTIAEADVVISSVATSDPFIGVPEVARLSVAYAKHFVDLAVPRSVTPEVAQLAGISVHNIDTITARTSEALARRERAIPRVEAIMDSALEDFFNWSREMVVSPTIHKLKSALEEIRQAELARYTKRLSEEQTEVVDQVTRSMMQKIIKLPAIQLKAACQRGDAESLVSVLHDLFNLEATAEAERNGS